MKTIKLSNQAISRLTEISDYYRSKEKSPQRAIKVIQSFDTSFQQIANDPYRYRKFLSNKYKTLDIRQYLHFKTYHIYYLIKVDNIIILEIFHLKQNATKINLSLSEI
jgi:plasmid stabilization system protein ParE